MNRSRLFGILGTLIVVLVALFLLLREDGGAPADGSSTFAVGERTESPPATTPHARSRPELDAPAAVVWGVVYDEANDPIGGADVCLWPLSDLATLRQQMVARCELSDAAGHYEIEAPIPGSVRVAAGKERFVARSVPAEGEAPIFVEAGQRRRVDIVLSGGGVPVRGTVVDLTGGPIAGAWVRGHAETLLDSLRLFGSPTTNLTTTDDEGRFELWVRPGKMMVSATAAGYGYAYGGGQAPAAGIELRLSPEAIIEGRVVDADDRPLPALVVEAGSAVQYDGTRLITRSDARGRFRLEGLPPGEYRPRAVGPRGRGEVAEKMAIGPGETKTTTIVVAPGQEVTIDVVVGSDRRPCPDGWVRLTSSDRRYRAAIETGVGLLQGIPAGSYDALVRCHEAVADVRESIVVGEAPVTTEVVVEQGLRVSGLVVDDRRDPIQHATVFAKGPRPQLAYTDAGGRFVLAGLASGAYRIRATRRGLRPSEPLPVEVEDELPAQHIELRLSQGASIRIVVTTEGGDPIPDVPVIATPIPGGQSSYCHTNHHGTCTLRGLPDGSHEVDVLDLLGADDAPGVRVRATDGRASEARLIRPSRSSVLEGKVVDPHGTPLPDVAIVALPQPETTDPERVRSALLAKTLTDQIPHITDQDGRFRIEDLAPGTYAIRAAKFGGAQRIVTGIATDTRDIEIVIDNE